MLIPSVAAKAELVDEILGLCNARDEQSAYRGGHTVNYTHFVFLTSLKLYLFLLGEKPADVVAELLFVVVRNEIRVDEDTMFASTGRTGWVMGVFSDLRST